MTYPTDTLTQLGLIVGFSLTVAIYSYQLYKETILYRIAEHIYLGIAFAIVGVTAYETVIKTTIVPLRNGEIIYIIPLILGLMMYTLFSKDYRWASRYPVSVLIGTSLGVSMSSLIIPGILNQVKFVIDPGDITGAMGWLNFIYIGIGTICSLMYFILTHEHTGNLKAPTRLGRYVLMIGLGVMFGNTVLFRMSMLTGRFTYLLQVLGIIPM